MPTLSFDVQDDAIAPKPLHLCTRGAHVSGLVGPVTILSSTAPSIDRGKSLFYFDIEARWKREGDELSMDSLVRGPFHSNLPERLAEILASV